MKLLRAVWLLRSFPAGRPSPGAWWGPEVQVDRASTAAGQGGWGMGAGPGHSTAAPVGPWVASPFHGPVQVQERRGSTQQLVLRRWLLPGVSFWGAEQQVSDTILCQLPPGAKKGRLGFCAAPTDSPGSLGKMAEAGLSGLVSRAFGGEEHLPRLGRVPQPPRPAFLRAPA